MMHCFAQAIGKKSLSFNFLKYRDEIAACLEKSYQRISFQEAQRMLYFDSEKDTKAFATKVSYSSYWYYSTIFSNKKTSLSLIRRSL